MGRRLLTTKLANRLQARVEAHTFGDTAAVLTHVVASRDAAGQPVFTETSTPISCSFTDRPFEFEKWRDYGDVESIIAQARFTSPAPTKGDRLKLTARFGDASYVDKTYEIVGIMDRGIFGYVVDLKAAQI